MSGLASLLLATALLSAPLPAPQSMVAPPPPAETLMEIPAELEVMLQQRVVRRSQSDPEKLQRLVDLMFDPKGLALHYGTTDTHSVAESFATRRVNCLSFSLMFVAMARQVGLDARAQEVGDVISWYEKDGLAYANGHLNARARMDGRVFTVDLDSSMQPSRRGPRAIPDRRLFAHYYNNRGAELLSAGQDASARAYFHAALQSDDTLADTWNNLGLLNAREGALLTAMADYDRALALDPQHVSALGNALGLSHRLGDTARASMLLAQLKQVRARDPFHQYTLGIEAERAGRYEQAARYYAQAIKLYPDAHQFHFGLARMSVLAGNLVTASRELQAARTLSPAGEQQRYQAKLEGLRRLARERKIATAP